MCTHVFLLHGLCYAVSPKRPTLGCFLTSVLMETLSEMLQLRKQNQTGQNEAGHPPGPPPAEAAVTLRGVHKAFARVWPGVWPLTPQSRSVPGCRRRRHSSVQASGPQPPGMFRWTSSREKNYHRIPQSLNYLCFNMYVGTVLKLYLNCFYLHILWVQHGLLQSEWRFCLADSSLVSALGTL